MILLHDIWVAELVKKNSYLEDGFVWSHPDLKLTGLSWAGIRTSIALPELGICFDVAQGLPFTVRQKKFFITHGHQDHAAGIPYIISQKGLNNLPTPDFYMPKSLVEPMTEIIQTWSKIERHDYKYNLVGIDEGSVIELNSFYEVRPFETVHRVDSFGYTLFKKHKQLKPEFQKLSQDQIKLQKNSGLQVDETLRTPLFSITGDTQIEFLDRCPHIKNSKILMIECTYLDDRKSISDAKKWGHIHLDELIEHLPSFNCEIILIKHLSSRYSLQEAQQILSSKLPKSELDRVQIFQGQ